MERGPLAKGWETPQVLRFSTIFYHPYNLGDFVFRGNTLVNIYDRSLAWGTKNTSLHRGQQSRNYNSKRLALLGEWRGAEHTHTSS